MGVRLNAANYFPELVGAKPKPEQPCVDDDCGPKPFEPCIHKDGCGPTRPQEPCFGDDCKEPKKPDYRIESGFNSLWKYDNVIGAEKGDGKGVPEPKEAPTKDGKLTVEVEGGMIGPIPNGKVKLTYETPAPGCDLVIPKE